MIRKWYELRHKMLWSRLIECILNGCTIDEFYDTKDTIYFKLVNDNYLPRFNSCFICDYMCYINMSLKEESECAICFKRIFNTDILRDKGCLNGIYDSLNESLRKRDYSNAVKYATQIRDIFPEEVNHEQQNN